MRSAGEAHAKRCASGRFLGLGSDPVTRATKTAPTRRIPKLGRHSSGQARVILGGKTYYCGRWGSPEAHARYAELVRAWQQNGEQLLVGRRLRLQAAGGHGGF